ALPLLSTSSFFLHFYGDHRALHSFPTRRSSDLRQENSQLLMAIRDVLTSANFGAGAGAPDSIRQKIGEKMSGFFGRFDRGVFKRSEEHTSELQSRENLVCRLLLEKKKKRYNNAK